VLFLLGRTHPFHNLVLVHSSVLWLVEEPVVKHIKRTLYTMRLGEDMQCAKCPKKLGGLFGEIGNTVILEGEERLVCDDCYEMLKKEYGTKKTCEDCFHFNEAYCARLNMKLARTTIGIFDYFAQAEECANFVLKKEYEKKALRGETANEEKQPKATEIIREKIVIVKVRCPYCGKLYDEALDVCPHCGGKR
jgi:hypothetical protein